jgi:hypothetical protein
MGRDKVRRGGKAGDGKRRRDAAPKAAETQALPLRRAQGGDDDALNDVVRPATREETAPAVMAALLLGLAALVVCFNNGYVLLYGDAVAHLGIARRILDSRNPGLVQLGGVWLPLPHLLMLPFVWKMEWWQTGLAGAWPSLLCYVAGVAGFFRLCRRVLAPKWAWAATAFYGLNPNLLYLATTAMTEPLFLALLVWMVLGTVECVDAVRARDARVARQRMVWLGVLIFCAVFTRYDGWVVGAAVWGVVAWAVWRARGAWDEVRGAFVTFSVLAVAGPLLWLGYNQHFFHDWLDFMRGPYSAGAIERKTSPPGSRHYRGWHNVGWALLFYTRTAQVDAAWWELGFGVMAAALAGVWAAVRRQMGMVALLLWAPLGFYVYSVAYGSVPIFIPQLWPHSYYNARYGMELLPALGLFGAMGAAAMEARFGAARRRVVYGVALGLVGLNAVAMVYGVGWVEGVVGLMRHRDSTAMQIYAPPLVLEEALVNATTRVPFERDVALVLEEFPAGSVILMEESAHVGALQDAGIALKQTVNEADYDSFHAALRDPAGHAQYVVAFAGDAVSQAVAARPEGLEELTILCGTGQGCARVYRSTEFAGR